MKYICTLNGKKYEVQVEKVDDYTPLTRAEVAAPAPAAAPVAAPAAPAAPAPAPVAAAPAPAPAPAAAPAAAGASNVTAPMPGNILDISVSVGQAVTAGQTVLTMEAMKMENEIVAPAAGTVKEIRVKKGDVVNTDDVLVVLG